MVATALKSPRFVRRTQLGPNEYRKNFHQIDQDVLAAVTSPEADRVTPLMSKIYLRLVSAPTEFHEREGVLYFAAGEEEGRPIKASRVLYRLLGVASATAHKALGWMHEQGIIGYFAGKNGVGIRIFLNRASGSIGVRPTAGGKKILPFGRSSNEGHAGSSNEPAFNDSFAVSEISDKDLNPRAPKAGAVSKPVAEASTAPVCSTTPRGRTSHDREEGELSAQRWDAGIASIGEVVERLRSELERCVREVASRAASQSAAREMERTREWFETKALPKAVRVAQRETYDLLRKHSAPDELKQRARSGLEIGRSTADFNAPRLPRQLLPKEIRETAEICLALLEAQGKPVDVTLSEMTLGGSGWLLPEDALRIRKEAQTILLEQVGRES